MAQRVAERPASAAHQTGGKFAYANLMTDWGVGCMQWFGGTALLSRVLDRHSVQRQFECNEEDTRHGACTDTIMGPFGRTIGIGTWLENGSLLTLIGDMKLACYTLPENKKVPLIPNIMLNDVSPCFTSSSCWYICVIG